MSCGDPAVSDEQCGKPWYESYSARGVFIGALLGALVGGAAAAGSGAAAIGVAGAAGAGSVLGGFLGYFLARASAGRLRIIQHDKDATGVLIDCGRASVIFPFGDGDYLFNIRCVPDDVLTTNANCTRVKGGTSYLHCEITSNVGRFGNAASVIGGAAAAAGAATAGEFAGTSVAGGCLALGLFAPLCLIAALVVAFFAAAILTAIVSVLTGMIGGLIGLIADEIADQVGAADADSVHCFDIVTFTGDWVTDTDHGWNEIHDVERAKIETMRIEGCADAQQNGGGIGVGFIPPRPRRAVPV